MTIRETILRLEEVLQSWEEHRLLDALALYATKRMRGEAAEQPAISIPQDFRNFLLRAREDTRVEDRFLYDAPTEDLEKNPSRWYNYDAHHLLAWTTRSRKVYKIPPNMQTLLMHTSLQGMTWGEIKLPYDAFAICIESPIKVGEDSFDCFIVSNDPDKIVIHGSGPNRNPWSQIGPMFLAKVRKLCREKRWDEVQEMIRTRYEFRDSHSPPTLYIGASPADQLIEQTSEMFQEQYVITPDFVPKIPETQVIFRLVAGLCLYVSSLPGKVVRVKTKQKTDTVASVDRSAIVNGADIMTVANFFTLTRSDEEFIRTIEQSRKGEMPVHWRRGFWRRTPGTGHIPDAPKNQWIRPTLVRADRLPEVGVPAGTLLSMKKPRS